MEIQGQKLSAEEILQKQIITPKSCKGRIEKTRDEIKNELLQINQIVLDRLCDGKKFILDEKNESAFDQAVDWLAIEGGKPGLLIRGAPGTGKTNMVISIMEIIRINNGLKVLIIPTRDLNEAAGRDDQYTLDKVLNNRVVCFEDLGTEDPKVNYMGSVKYPFIDYFSRRYDKRLPTIVTTNIQPSGIEAIYGVRIRERMQETMTDVVFKGKSRRS